MDNTENNSWDEISNDVSEVKKKIKDKVVSENSIDDLKDSFQLTIETVSYTHLTLPTNREV